MSAAANYTVGESRLSQRRTIGEADVTLWSGLVHDFTSLHVDAELMASSVFGRRIAHGYIAFNLAVGLFFPTQRDWYAPDPAVTTERWTDVRFTAPVFIGDTLQCRRTVVAVEPVASGVTVTHQVEVLKQDGQLVMTGREELLFPA